MYLLFCIDILYNTNMVKTCLWICLKSQMIKKIGIESYIIFG
jgi:hypothetical protein